MTKELTKDEFVNYFKRKYSLDENTEKITFNKVGEIIQFYLDNYKNETFKDNFEYVLLHKYYKDFLEEVMPIIENVNTLYENSPLRSFNLELYQKADLANKFNKQIIDRILLSFDAENINESPIYGELINLMNIKDNNIFKKNIPHEEIRAAHDMPHLDYSKEHTEPIKSYFITKENLLKKELLKNCSEEDLELLDDLLNTFYEYDKCKRKSEATVKTL